MSNALEEVLEDHLKFLLLMADVVGHSISNQAWIRVRACLSPTSRFIISDPVMMAPELFTKATVHVCNKVIFKERGQIKLYVKYKFPDYEAAACSDFLFWGAPFNLTQTVDIDGVSHKMTRDPDSALKIISIVAVEKTKAVDIYSRLIAELSQQPK